MAPKRWCFSCRSGADDPSNDTNQHEHRLAGLLTDDASISWLPEGRNKNCEPTKNGEPPGSLKICIPHPPKTLLWRDEFDDDDGYDNYDKVVRRDVVGDNNERLMDNIHINDGWLDLPRVSLLLALPRPLQLQRILPMIAQLGVERIILTNANKVPTDYFGCRVLRDPLLVEGLSVCGNDVVLPTVTVTKRLPIFLKDELDSMFPPGEYARVIAHPTRSGSRS